MSTRGSSMTSLLLFLLCILGLTRTSLAIKSYANVLIPWVESNGDVVYFRDFRQPALYTGAYADCRGNSLINISRFDVAYYKDNLTVSFHLEGRTSLENQTVMVSIAVYAYGETRYELIFNPCNANIDNLCPMNNNETIVANGVIPVSPDEVSLIPDLALSIPDFEGQAILRMYTNSSQSEIACYSAVVTNGRTFSQPVAVGSALGAMTLVAVFASFATAIYCDSIRVTRKHYAHSISILVIFEVFQSIYFTGALSVNWPSVLPAFWSNYAWAAGMIYSHAVESSITKFLGGERINISRVGAAAAGYNNDNVGGGYSIDAIYPDATSMLRKRDLPTVADGYLWYGTKVGSGVPLPGNFSGFPGTLSPERIPMSNAFLTGLVWFFVLLVAVIALVPLFKWIVEGLASVYLIRRNTLTYFRKHWLCYSAFAVLRTTLAAFFMLTFLSLLQISAGTASNVTAIAAVVFITLSLGMVGIASYACFSELRSNSRGAGFDNEARENTTMTNLLEPSNATTETLNENVLESQDSSKKWMKPFMKSESSFAEQQSVHEKLKFTKRYGWLASRYRKSKWWFFVAWLIYQFVRACFLAGAVFQPKVQIFGLLVVEILAFAGMIIVRPYEGQRLNAIAVYLLGLSKVVCTALCASFVPSFNVSRITATAIGIVIIVIQGFLTIFLLIAIVAGALSTYASLTRNHDHFTPEKMKNVRTRYFRHLDRAALETPQEKKVPKEKKTKTKQSISEIEQLPGVEPELPKEPYFRVSSIRRMSKIEDDEQDSISDMDETGQSDHALDKRCSPKRRNTQGTLNSFYSNKSRNSLPYGARRHRSSWSTREFDKFDEHGEEDLMTPSSSMFFGKGNGSRVYDAVAGTDASFIPPVPDLSSSPYTNLDEGKYADSSPSVRPRMAHETFAGNELRNSQLEAPSSLVMDRLASDI